MHLIVFGDKVIWPLSFGDAVWFSRADLQLLIRVKKCVILLFVFSVRVHRFIPYILRWACSHAPSPVSHSSPFIVQWIASLVAIGTGCVVLCQFHRCAYTTAVTLYTIGMIFDILSVLFWWVTMPASVTLRYSFYIISTLRPSLD